MILFNSQKEGQSLRKDIDQVFRAAYFLEYNTSEQQLVERIVMNFLPNISTQAAFLDKPSSLKQLYQVSGLIEEKIAVSKQSQLWKGHGCLLVEVGLDPVMRQVHTRYREGASVSAPPKC